MSKWLSDGLNWAEQVLESVDQTAGKTIDKVREEVPRRLTAGGAILTEKSRSTSHQDLKSENEAAEPAERKYQSSDGHKGAAVSDTLALARDFLAEDEDEDEGGGSPGHVTAEISVGPESREWSSGAASADGENGVQDRAPKAARPTQAPGGDSDLMQAELASLNEEISHLTTALRKTKDKLEYTQQTLKETERSKTELERNFDERVDAILKEKRDLEDQFSNAFVAKDRKAAELQDAVNDLEKLLSDANAHIAKQEESEERLENDLAALREEHSEAMVELNKLRMSGEAELMAEKTQFENEVRQSRSREMELEEERGQYTRLLATSQRALDDKVNELHQVEQQLRLTEGEVESKSQELHSVQCELEHEMAKTQRLSGEVASLQHQLVAAKDEVSELKDAEARAAAATTEATAMRQRCDELERKAADLEEKIKAFGPDTTRAYEEKIKALADRSEKQRVSIQDLTTTNTKLQSQIEQLRRQAKEEEIMGSRATVTAMAATVRYRDGADEFGLRSRAGQMQNQDFVPHVIEEKAPRVAEAARAIDRYSMATGSYLRRNPIARLMFAVYIIILHLWVFFVLMSAAHLHTPQASAAPGLGTTNMATPNLGLSPP